MADWAMLTQVQLDWIFAPGEALAARVKSACNREILESNRRMRVAELPRG